MMLKIINLIAFAAMVAANYLANALPINGKTTGQLSDQFPNLFVPAGVTFSIWGVIYLFLLGYTVLQFSPQHKSTVQTIGLAFAISCLLNCLWIFTWHYEKLPLSMLIMLGLLASLIFVAIRVQSSESIIIKAAFGIYLGWICIATIANMTALLVHYNWGSWGISHETWTIIMIAAGTVIAMLASVKFYNPYTALAVIWALTGIIIKRQSDYLSIVIVAAIGITLLAVTTVLLFTSKARPVQ